MGVAKLEPLAGADQEARFGIGFLRFAVAIEGLAQGLYRHGFAAPDGGPMVGRPLAMPVPTNPNPEPLTYEKFRALLQQLVDGTEAARPVLLEAGASGDYVVPSGTAGDPCRYQRQRPGRRKQVDRRHLRHRFRQRLD